MTLSPTTTVVSALLFVWAERRSLLRLLALPTVVIVLLRVVSWQFEAVAPIQWLFHFLKMPLFVLFAVSCHQVVLDQSRVSDAPWGIRWSSAEWRFLGWSLSVGLLAGVAATLCKLGVTELLDAIYGDWHYFENHLLTWGVRREFMVLATLPAAYIGARLSLVLPASAIGRRASLGNSWRSSQGNGWRLTIAVGVIPVIAALLKRGFATLPLGEPLEAALTIAFVLFGACGIAVLSVAYRQLAADYSEVPPNN